MGVDNNSGRGGGGATTAGGRVGQRREPISGRRWKKEKSRLKKSELQYFFVFFGGFA